MPQGALMPPPTNATTTSERLDRIEVALGYLCNSAEIDPNTLIETVLARAARLLDGSWPSREPASIEGPRGQEPDDLPALDAFGVLDEGII